MLDNSLGQLTGFSGFLIKFGSTLDSNETFFQAVDEDLLDVNLDGTTSNDFFTGILVEFSGNAGTSDSFNSFSFLNSGVDLIGGFTSDMLAVVREQNPLRRLCSPREIGSAVAFLASSNSGFINGELLCIDGGRREFYWG